jgi:hypothetical protein
VATVLIIGASRGIGLEMEKRAAVFSIAYGRLSYVESNFRVETGLCSKRRIQLRLSIFTINRTAQGCSIAPWRRGAKLEIGVATRASISTQQTALSVPESK